MTRICSQQILGYDALIFNIWNIKSWDDGEKSKCNEDFEKCWSTTKNVGEKNECNGNSFSLFDHV